MTAQQIEAANLVAEDRIPDRKIAETVGIGARTLQYWKRLPDFVREVEQVRQEWRERVRRRGVASKDTRLANLNGLLRRHVGFMQTRAEAMVKDVLSECAECERQATYYEKLQSDRGSTDLDLEIAKLRSRILNLKAVLPMVRTGMARCEIKSLHVAKDSYEVVREWFHDHQLATEIRATMEQAAIEVGDWKNKIQVEDNTAQGFITALAAVLTPDELDQIEARLKAQQPNEPERDSPDTSDLGDDQSSPESPAAE